MTSKVLLCTNTEGEFIQLWLLAVGRESKRGQSFRGGAACAMSHLLTASRSYQEGLRSFKMKKILKFSYIVLACHESKRRQSFRGGAAFAMSHLLTASRSYQEGLRSFKMKKFSNSLILSCPVMTWEKRKVMLLAFFQKPFSQDSVYDIVPPILNLVKPCKTSFDTVPHF